MKNKDRQLFNERMKAWKNLADLLNETTLKTVIDELNERTKSMPESEANRMHLAMNFSYKIRTKQLQLTN